MEHEDPPLADDGERGATPDDQPLGGPTGPEDEKMPQRPIHSDADDGPREPSPDDTRSG